MAGPADDLHLQERIDRNVTATWLCILAVVVLLTATAWFLGQIWDFGVPAAGIGFTIAVASSLIAYHSGDQMVLALLRARAADPRQHQELLNVAEEMAIASGLPVPQVYVIHSPASNALATGRDPSTATIAVTTGLLERLTRSELQAVVAHEMSHIRHRDTLYAVVVAVLVGTIVTMSDIFWRTVQSGKIRTSRDDTSSGKGEVAILVVGILLAVLAPVFAKLIQLAVSRRREYLADLGGADLTRNPAALADALEKIAGDPDRFDIANRGVQHLFVLNPVDPLSAGETLFADLLNTHPPLRERVRILRRLAHQPA